MCFVCSEYHREKTTSNTPPDCEEDREVRLDLRAGGLAGVVKTVKSLITNGAFVFVVLYGACDAIIVNGFVAFGPKYYQQQFGLTATVAGIAFGQSFYVCSITCVKAGADPEEVSRVSGHPPFA